MCKDCNQREVKPKRRICEICCNRRDTASKKIRRQLIGSAAQVSFVFYRLKNRAKLKNFEFNLTRQDIKNLYSNYDKPCPYCEKSMVSKTKNRVSIDRIDNMKGYTLSNCLVVCLNCNIKKHCLSKTQIINMSKALLK